MSQYNHYTYWNRPGTPLRDVPRWISRIASRLVSLSPPPRRTTHPRFMHFVRDVAQVMVNSGQNIPWNMSRRIAHALVSGISYDAVCWEFMYNLNVNFFDNTAGDSDDEDFGLSYFDDED